MSRKSYVILNLLLLIVVGGLFVYTYISKGTIENGDIMKGGIVAAGCIANMFRKDRKPAIQNYKKYEEAYKDILQGVFSEDKRSYNKLLKATFYYNNDKPGKMLKILNKLVNKCVRAKDYSAVYTFMALGFEEVGQYENVIAAYGKVLQYDMANTTAWSNMGLIYKMMGNAKEAYNSFYNAILYNPENAMAYSNMAHFYLESADPENALSYALKAIELNANVYQAMSTAAIAYKMLGDDENVEKYCMMYQINGGDSNKLKQYLATVE